VTSHGDLQDDDSTPVTKFIFALMESGFSAQQIATALYEACGEGEDT
jgi:hypothetical protein